MKEIIFYLEDNDTTNKKITKVVNDFITFVEIENVEMNYLKIIIRCRKEDEKSIETIMNG